MVIFDGNSTVMWSDIQNIAPLSSLRNNDLSARTSQKPMNKYPPFICYLLSLVIYSSLHPIDAKTPSKNISKESRLKAILW